MSCTFSEINKSGFHCLSSSGPTTSCHCCPGCHKGVGGNQTWVTDFILLGLQLSTKIETFLFWISLLYLFSLLANVIILVLIYLNPSLHTPMYFFLSHLAILDISYASNNVPKMLVNLVTQNKIISFVPCITQAFLYLALPASECLIKAAMSYGRLVAICHLLHYTIIMS